MFLPSFFLKAFYKVDKCWLESL